jgi:hypothetical protein
MQSWVAISWRTKIDDCGLPKRCLGTETPGMANSSRLRAYAFEVNEIKSLINSIQLQQFVIHLVRMAESACRTTYVSAQKNLEEKSANMVEFQGKIITSSLKDKFHLQTRQDAL